MIKVKFLQDEVISFGPQRVVKDQELELSEGLAQQFINSGIAVSTEAPAPRISLKRSKVKKEEEEAKEDEPAEDIQEDKEK